MSAIEATCVAAAYLRKWCLILHWNASWALHFIPKPSGPCYANAYRRG